MTQTADHIPCLPENIIIPGRMRMGRGLSKTFAKECERFGRRGILVHGESLRRSGSLAAILGNSAGLTVLPVEHASGEPTLDQLRSLLRQARDFKTEWIGAVGGGSVIDLAKACAGLFNSSDDPVVFHDGKRVAVPGIPFLAAPTTAGAGAEASPNAVLTNTESRTKKSIREDFFVARTVILDPDLLATCPRKTIAHSGMDALTQAIEAYTSRNATWFSDCFALKAIRLISDNIISVFGSPEGDCADNLLLGSYLGGVALSHARLGVVHGLAHPLGMLYELPHGLVCAVCLPHALRLNRPVIAAKYDQLSRILGGDAASATEQLNTRLGIHSPLKGLGIISREIIVRETLASGSTAANAKKITRDDINLLLDSLF